MSEWKVSYEEEDEKPSPIKHFVILDNVTMGNDETDIERSISAAKAADIGLMPSAFGVCVATNGDLDLDDIPDEALVSGEFRGVAIAKGNITVPSGMNVRGLLMATGTITVKGGGSKITYDKGLIQSRIEKEMSIVRNTTDGSDPYANDYMLIRYLSRFNGTDRLYNVEPGSKAIRDNIEADYNDFMNYENWKKRE